MLQCSVIREGVYYSILCSKTRLDHGVLAVGFDQQVDKQPHEVFAVSMDSFIALVMMQFFCGFFYMVVKILICQNLTFLALFNAIKVNNFTLLHINVFQSFEHFTTENISRTQSNKFTTSKPSILRKTLLSQRND